MSIYFCTKNRNLYLNNKEFIDELRAKIAEYTAELDSKFNGDKGKRYIMLCGGTGCVAGGTMSIKEKFEEYIQKRAGRPVRPVGI